MVQTPTKPRAVRKSEAIDADAPQLPESCATVSEIHGPYSVACCRSRTEGAIARYLADRFIDFYNPRRRVIRWYDGKRKQWGSALFPGILIVGHGIEGRDAVVKYGERHYDQVRGFIGFMYDGSIGAKLLSELGRVEKMLAADPDLEAISGLRKGRKVRVNAGPFIALEGIIDGDDGDGRVYVNLPLLGYAAPMPVARNLLDLID